MHEAWKVHSVPKRVEIVCVGWTDWSLVSDDVEVYSAWIRGLWLAGEPDGAGRSALSLTQRWRKTALQVNRDAFVNTIFSLLSLTCARNEADSIRERERKKRQYCCARSSFQWERNEKSRRGVQQKLASRRRFVGQHALFFSEQLRKLRICLKSWEPV